jgi:nucleotide-binding universal stress UspA family protein
VEKIEKIVVPVDFSPFSKRAFRDAALIARPVRAEVHLLHVIPEYEVESAFHIRLPDRSEVESKAAEWADKAYEDYLRGEDIEGLSIITSTRFGKPARAICEYANDVAADLIVIASHGRSGLERAVFGSVAERVLRTSDQTVMVAK